MVNKNELEIIKKYESQGWKTLRGGAPDFVFLKIEEKEIKDFQFVEVKPEGGRLTYAQSIYRKVLEMLGAKYKVETTRAIPHHPAPSYAQPVHPNPANAVLHQPAPVREPNKIPPKPPETSPPEATQSHATRCYAIQRQPHPNHPNSDKSAPVRSLLGQTIPDHAKPKEVKDFE